MRRQVELNERASLRTRVSGQSHISEVVRLHRLTPRRTPLARLLGASPLTAESRAWYRGAVAELAVGHALDNLGPRWDILHAIPTDIVEAGIDHVVIGPAGVFTINTRNHSGEDVVVDGATITVAGAQQPHIRSSIAEAERAARFLGRAAGRPINVTAVLVLVDPKSLTIRQEPSGVHIVTSAALASWFAAREELLSGDEVAFISDVADRASTWQSRPPEVEQDVQELHAEFAEVRSEVRTAIRRRVLWGAAAFFVLYCTVWGSVAVLVSRSVSP